MTGASARAPALVLALSLLPGCCWLWRPSGPETLVVVVPSRHDGHVGAVVVTKGEQRQVLATAYAGARVRERGHVHAATIGADEIERTFAQASAALPRKALSFTLYFELATKQLTAESETKLDQVLAEAATWAGAEIDVVGHTDRMGTPENNDALSLERAEGVRQILLRRGVKPEVIRAVGMGEREPVVETADGEKNAENRRVEVIIR